MSAPVTATAIANMVGTRIDMKVPNVKLMDVGKLGSAIRWKKRR